MDSQREKCSQKDWMWKNNTCQDPDKICKKQGDLIWHNKQCMSADEIKCESNSKNLWAKDKKICITEKEGCEANQRVWRKDKCIEKEVADCQDKNGLWDQEQYLCVSNEESSCVAQALTWNSAESRCVLLEETSCLKLESTGSVWKGDHCESADERNCTALPDVIWFENKCYSQEDYKNRQNELQCTQTQGTWFQYKCYTNNDEMECAKKEGYWAKKGEFEQKVDTCITPEQKRCYDMQGNTWKDGACVCVDPTMILANGGCLNKEKKECLDSKKNWVESGKLRQTKNICLTDEQALCFQLQETDWVDNACKCTDKEKKLFNRVCTPLEKAECLEKKDQNFVWSDPEKVCKSPERIFCEQSITSATSGGITVWKYGRCITTQEAKCLDNFAVDGSSKWDNDTKQCKSLLQQTCERDSTQMWIPTDAPERKFLDLEDNVKCITHVQYDCAVQIKNGLHKSWDNNTNACKCAAGYFESNNTCILKETFNFPLPKARLFCIEKKSTAFKMVNNFNPKTDSWKKGCKSADPSYDYSKTYIFRAYTTYFEGLEKFCYLTKLGSDPLLTKIGQGINDCNTAPDGWNIEFTFYASGTAVKSLPEFCLININNSNNFKIETSCSSLSTGEVKAFSFFAFRDTTEIVYEKQCVTRESAIDSCLTTEWREITTSVIGGSTCRTNNTSRSCQDSCEFPGTPPNIYGNNVTSGNCQKN